jgi:hypothetical protein
LERLQIAVYGPFGDVQLQGEVPDGDPVAALAERPQKNPLPKQRAVPSHGQTLERSIHMQRLREFTPMGGVKQYTELSENLIEREHAPSYDAFHSVSCSSLGASPILFGETPIRRTRGKSGHLLVGDTSVGDGTPLIPNQCACHLGRRQRECLSERLR